MCPGRRADDDRVEPARIEQRAVVRVQAGDPVPRAERLADGPARLGEPREREPVTQRREIRNVLGLRDEPAADDADADRHARTPWATFSNASAISSTSCSSRSGDMSTWIVAPERDRACAGSPGGGFPAAAIASSTGFQYG